MMSIFLWGGLIVAFLVIEAGTVALVSLWFAAGAAAALVFSLLGAALWGQALVFLAVSALLLWRVRPFLRKNVKITPTNVDSVIGSEGYVMQEINNLTASGQVKLGAMTWTARSTAQSVIPVGTRIRADRVEGVKVFVSPVSEEAAVEP